MPARPRSRADMPSPSEDNPPLAPGARGARIDSLMERASQALVRTDYAACEKNAREALRIAHAARDYERMTRIVLPLLEARRQKRQKAQDAKRITSINSMAELEGKELKPGCYLLNPPGCVGVDGRALRARADEEGVPVIVIVHEPITRTKEWPIVALGPTTIRARVEPAKAKPTVDWFLNAIDALGDAALASVDAASPPQRVDQLMACLETIGDHEGLHRALADECHDAMHWTPPPRSAKRAAAKQQPQTDADEPEADED